jgi:pimeloyl-ACP methyl ester carboxylesterase
MIKAASRLAAATMLAMSVAAMIPASAQTVAPLPERVTPKKTWTDHFWTGPDGTKFHYVEQGKGTPVILIHGLTSSAVNNWFNPGIAQKLAQTNRVIAIDMRGHGDTGPSPADSTGTMIHDVVDFMDYLKIQKAHIGGYSMGGATTAGLLKVAPERFLTASVMGIGIKEKPEWIGNVPVDAPVSNTAGRVAPAAPPTAAAAASPAGNPGRVNLNPGANGAPMGAPKGAPDANPEVDLTKIDFPVLSLNGSNDRPVAKTHRMWRELRDFTYVVIDGRNHMEACRDPLFADALVRFITSHNPVK